MLRRTDYQQLHAAEHVAARIAAAKLDVMLFKSRDGSLIFCQVRASRDRLCTEAARTEFKMQLDKHELYDAACDPKKYFSGEKWLEKDDYEATERPATRPIVLPQRVCHARSKKSRRHYDPYAAYDHITDHYKSAYYWHGV